MIHDYLPLHAAGSEIYTANLCRALADAGHEVAVFTCEENRDLEQWSLTEREHDGIPVFEAIYNRIYHDLSEQWDDPQMAAVFDGVLERFAPDLVHVQGLQFVGGVSTLKAAHARRIPVVMTLHEYWWLCPRAGLMFDPDGKACETAEARSCARCVDIYPIDRERWSDAACGNSHADLGDRRWFARALEGRAADMAGAVELVSRFIAPSNFLGERFIGAGFPREKVVMSDYGFPAVETLSVGGANRSGGAGPSGGAGRPAANAPLRIGYVGTLSDYKGPEVFARAVESSGLGPERLRATFHGHLDWFPDLAERLRALAARVPALELVGPFAPSEREQVLAGLDLMVVPSLWWENSPLTIHEAHQRGIPVLTSDRGGMAELVSHGGGRTFPPGNHVALAGLIRALVDDPGLVDALRRSIPAVKPIEDDVALLERLMGELAG